MTEKFKDVNVFEFKIRILRDDDAASLAFFYSRLSERSRYFFEPYPDTSVQAMTDVVKRAVTGTDFAAVALSSDEEIVAHLFFKDVKQAVPL